MCWVAPSGLVVGFGDVTQGDALGCVGAPRWGWGSGWLSVGVLGRLQRVQQWTEAVVMGVSLPLS